MMIAQKRFSNFVFNGAISEDNNIELIVNTPGKHKLDTITDLNYLTGDFKLASEINDILFSVNYRVGTPDVYNFIKQLANRYPNCRVVNAQN